MEDCNDSESSQIINGHKHMLSLNDFNYSENLATENGKNLLSQNAGNGQFLMVFSLRTAIFLTKIRDCGAATFLPLRIRFDYL